MSEQIFGYHNKEIGTTTLSEPDQDSTSKLLTRLGLVEVNPGLMVIIRHQMERFLRQTEAEGNLGKILAEGANHRDRVLFLELLADNPRADPQTGKQYSTGRSRQFDLGYGIYYDAAYSFALTFQDSPLAAISFNQEFDYLDVKQIQGVKDRMSPNELRKGRSKARNGDNTVLLREFGNWELSLLRIVEEYARSIGIAEVRVLPAAKNIWKSLEEEKGREHYDQTAQKLGYVYDFKLDRFVKILPGLSDNAHFLEGFEKPEQLIDLPSIILEENISSFSLKSAKEESYHHFNN